jgi:hypothetical protein
VSEGTERQGSGEAEVTMRVRDEGGKMIQIILVIVFEKKRILPSDLYVICGCNLFDGFIVAYGCVDDLVMWVLQILDVLNRFV